MDNILIICRCKKDLYFFDKVPESKKSNIIVASDDPLIQETAKNKFQVKEVTFIEQMESSFSVADDVFKIRDKVNKWLVKLCPNISPYILKWIKWAERGSTTQKIQDALLLINSYINLISKYEINKLLLYRRIETFWEDKILLATAKSMGVASKDYKNLIFLLSRAFNIILVRRKIFGKKCSIYMPQSILTMLKKLIFLVKIFRCKLNYNVSSKTNAKEITFLLGSSEDKHVDNTAIVMIEFRRRNGYLPIALCWNELSGYSKIKMKGLKANNLESWFPLRDTYKVFRNYWLTKSSCLKYSKQFKNETDLFYVNVPLGEILWPFIIRFIDEDFLFRLFLFFSSHNYLRHNKPVAVKTWGENILFFGLLFFNVLKEINNKEKTQRPIVFHYPVGITMENPYYDSIDEPDLLFVSGKIDAKISLAYLNNNTNVIVSGFGQNSKIIIFKKKYNYEDSKNILQIYNSLDYNIFYAPFGIVRGWISPVEHIRVAESLIKFALLHKNISLIVKPHPAEDELFWFDLLSKFGNISNIYLIDKNKSPYHCINICDFVITKFSTIALEAMDFEKPVISVVLDGEKKFLNIFEDGVEKFTDIESLILFMDDIISDSVKFKIWKKRRLIAQKKFLPKKMYKPKKSVEKIIVDSVIEGIEKIIQ